MQPVETPLPLFLAKSGHKGIVYREPYGVTLIMGPFNGPLLSLLRPAITALAAGNTCILKVSEAPATATLLLTLIRTSLWDIEADITTKNTFLRSHPPSRNTHPSRKRLADCLRRHASGGPTEEGPDNYTMTGSRFSGGREHQSAELPEHCAAMARIFWHQRNSLRRLS
jgi:hypothetical protein